MKQLNIYFEDLTYEAQEAVLEFFGIETMSDLNLEIVPLFTLETQEDEVEI